MAALSNRSPSPNPSRPSNLNPNCRNQENNSPATRKSFSGNNPLGKPSVLNNLRRYDPTTPANSPSDLARRSVGKDSCVALFLNSCEEKENDEKDMNCKAAKLRSLAKNSKNFMSPTISAASKFTPSPRKKVLVERNDPVRTAVSLSDGKAMFFSTSLTDYSETLEPKSDQGFDAEVAESQKNGGSIREDPVVSKPSKKVTFLAPTDSESVTTDSHENYLESGLKNMSSCSDVSPSIAPLDADPSMPPYDPKTNYLSPRPQFLYYKPNPRIDMLLNKNRLDSNEFVQLEDGFTEDTLSETATDSEFTDESQVENYLQEEEPELTASADMVVGVTDMEELSSLGVELPESLPVSYPSTNDKLENSENKIDRKQWGFSRLLCGSMLMIVLIAFASIYITHSPLVDEFVLKDLGFPDFSDLYHQSKEKFDRVARHVNQFQVDSLSFISTLMNKLIEGELIGPLQFTNLTDLQKKIWNEEQFQIHRQGLMEEDLEEEKPEEFVEVDTDERFDEESEEYDILVTEESSPDLEMYYGLEINISENDVEGEDWFQKKIWNEGQFHIHHQGLMEDLEEDDPEEFTEDKYAVDDTDERFGEESEESDILETEESFPNLEMFSGLETEISENGVEGEHHWVAPEEDQLAASSQDQEIELVPEPTDAENFEAETNLGPSAGPDDVSSLNRESSLEVDLPAEITDAENFEAANNLGPSSGADVNLLNHESSSEVDLSGEETVEEGSPILESPRRTSEEKFPTNRIISISLVLMTLLSVAALLHLNKKSPSPANVLSQTEPLVVKKKQDHEYAGTEHISHARRLSTQTEVDLLGGSCPSEISSFQKSYREMNGADEVQGLENKPKRYSKRESLASSSGYSAGSPSYGSFTTYERIPAKHANRDEDVEVITPVRRSSRLRSQITSP